MSGRSAARSPALAQQGHALHLAYQVSGSSQVRDEVVERYADFLEHMQMNPPALPPDPARLRAALRRAEARGAARICGVLPERLHFLNLPFYEARAPKATGAGPMRTSTSLSR